MSDKVTWQGHHFSQLDQKKRLYLPSAFRAPMTVFNDEALWLGIPLERPCFWLLSRAGNAALQTTQESLSHLLFDEGPESAAWRLSLSTFAPAAMKDSRVPITDAALEQAQIDISQLTANSLEVRLIGMGPKIEVWRTDLYNDYKAAEVARIRAAREHSLSTSAGTPGPTL